MSKPSIRTGSVLHAERAWPARRARRRAAPAALAAQPVLGEREHRVALGELAQAALRAALRDPHLDRRPPRRCVSASATSVRALGELAAPTTTRRGTDGAAE